jgi:hypothetical protein
MRWPSTDQPGAGAKERAHTGPNSSKHRVVESGAGWVGVGLDSPLPFWDEVRVLAEGPGTHLAPMHAFFEQDAAYLAAFNGNAGLVSGADQRI